MPTVTIWDGQVQKTVKTVSGALLEDVLQEAGCMLVMPCGGNGTCGKCRIRTSGELSEISVTERALLGDRAADEGIRLACMAKTKGDCTVWLKNDRVETLSWAFMPKIRPNGKGYGAAVDIGTTTVAVRLFDNTSGAVLAEALEGNRQAAFGSDVISRIGNAGDGNAEKIFRTIRVQLEEMVTSCIHQAGITGISSAVITGNTTMLHFYEGLDAAGIACAPFTAASLFDILSTYPLMREPTYLPPCIGAYVGADTVCAILAAGMTHNPDRITLLADIGTNGEIALMKDGRLYCCSTAAGPAFEGASLYNGMRASAGAITGLSLLADNTVSVSVLPNGKAVGLCGSGALDAVSVMLRLGVIDGSGRILPGYQGQGAVVNLDGQKAWQIPGTRVVMTQKDVRQIQLSKSAICAGINTLLEHTGVPANQVESFYVAGGFGHSMNAKNAAHIGLIPHELLEKVEVIGNGALAGASMLLLDSDLKAQAKHIQSISEELELSSSQVFMDFYVDGMLFAEEE